MKECHFEQPFAIFGIYQVYLKKLGKIKMDAVTIATSNSRTIKDREMIFWFNTVKV